MKTRSYNFDHLIYQTFIKKDLGSDRGIHSFTLFSSKIDCGCTHNLFLSQKKTKQQQQNYHNFQMKIVFFSVVKIQD